MTGILAQFPLIRNERGVGGVVFLALFFLLLLLLIFQFSFNDLFHHQEYITMRNKVLLSPAPPGLLGVVFQAKLGNSL